MHPFERYRSIVDDWAAFLDSLTHPLPTCVWTNTLRSTPARLANWFQQEEIDAVPLPWYKEAFQLPSDVSTGNLIPYRAGHCHVQEEVSLIPAFLLDPHPGEQVLDMCAAPGNKTAQIGVAMKNRGTLIANDRSEGRLHVLRRTLARLGVMNATTTIEDAARYPGSSDSFDRILVDAPCSCEGTSRKHPRVLNFCGEEQSRRMGGVQKRMLQRAIQLCKPGGRIVYSTCTYAPEENEAVVDAALNEHNGTVQVIPASLPGLIASPGLDTWNGTSFDTSLRHASRIWPHQNDSGGFFVAILQKATAT